MDEDSALAEFQSLTSYSISSDSARRLLDKHGWDLTSAVNEHFEGDSIATPDNSYPPVSSPSSHRPPASGAGANSSNSWLNRIIGRILLLPVSLLTALLSIPFSLLRVLRRPNPFLSAPALSPVAASERWKQSIDGGDVWYTGRYEDVLRLAKEKKRVMLTVLTCDQHEHDDEFKRSVLRDAELLHMLSTNDVVCWGGDVRHRDAYLVSTTIQNYAYPCIALTSLTSSSPSNMVVLSRLEGSSAMSSQTIQSTISNVLSRVEPFLSRERREAEQRMLDRIRREQDEQRLRETARKDTERILARREEERVRKEREESERRKSVDKERKKQIAKDKRASDEKWRVATKKYFADHIREPTTGGSRIGVRLGDGRRLMRTFDRQDPLRLVYAWVESERATSSAAVDATDSSTGQVSPFDQEKAYDFTLVTAFPRRIVSLEDEQTIESAGLVPDASLVVEFQQSGSGDDSTDEEEEDGDEV